VVGFICYSGAIAALVVDVGQPLRAWFTFWHPNVHSMLTEVTFCISCYLCVLAVEYLPILLRNRGMKKNLSIFAFEFELHKVMVVFAAVGTFLSFFHQGSLGGLYGVMRGRPFAFREGLAIWPSTFFLFILSAVAVGPSFLALITWMVVRITRKPLVKPEVLDLLARISGRLLLVYVLAKTIDTLVWLNRTSEASGFHPYGFYSNSTFGSWLLGVEIVLLGLVPAVILSRKSLRARTGWLVTGATLACLGVALNRFVQTIQTQALPTLPTDRLLVYWPSWQEIGVGVGVIAYGVILYSLSYRYLPLFPQERELQGS
jgi:molybdopterin-containing oxidoreductase family membrane subunit